MKKSVSSALLLILLCSCSSGLKTPEPTTDVQRTLSVPSGQRDTTPPRVTMVLFPAVLKTEGFVFFQLGTHDESKVARIVLSIDGQPFVDDHTAYNSYASYFRPGDNGSHVVQVKVYDDSDNVTELEQEFQVLIAP